MLWRGAGLIDWPVKVCTLVLIGIIVISVLVFHLGMKNDTLVDAFYRTVSLMATGADMGGGDVEPGGWQKLYISFLRLVGTALLAAFTAIFTNYLVRANLGGALEVRRIPDSGHIVVCGLGNVSYRVVEELLAQDEQVAAIERSAANPLIATARRQKVPVIIGDATVEEVLRQTNTAQARAVVVATDNELTNLEIALQVVQLNPKQRVVVRIIDPVLARTLREAANVRHAISIPELAAPAFTAALFGDQVRSLVMAKGRLLAAYDIIVEPGETELLSRTLLEIGREFKCVAIQWLRSGQAISLDPAGRPSPGDRLTVVIALADLQRLPFNAAPAGPH
jgi:Trk K+ transport system NAD-binding subunit